MSYRKPLGLIVSILAVTTVVVFNLNDSHTNDVVARSSAIESNQDPETPFSAYDDFTHESDSLDDDNTNQKPLVWTDESIYWPGEKIGVNHELSSQSDNWVALFRANEKTPLQSFHAKANPGRGTFSAEEKGDYIIRAFSKENGEQLGEDVPVTVDVIAAVSHGNVQGKEEIFKDNLNNDQTTRAFAFPSIKFGVVDPKNQFGLAKPRTFTKGTEKTNFFPPGCPQKIFKRPDIPKNTSLDCLYLSVYSVDRTRSLPVVIYIHGGNFENGNQGFYHGARLAVAAKVVVVSINYRLNVWGSLYLPGTTAVGNQMLSDQVLALKWVQRNIRYFGGNPRKVTIMGQSAGGTSVLSLMATSSIKKDSLFQRVISFSAPVNLKSQTPNSWKPWNAMLNRKSGCNVRGINTPSGNRKFLACFSKLSIADILKAQFATKKYFQARGKKTMIKDMLRLNFGPKLTTGQPWTITVGARHPGVYLKKEVMDIFKECKNKGKHGYPIIIGYCKDDAYEWSPTDVQTPTLGVLFKGLAHLNGKGKIFKKKRYSCNIKGGQKCQGKFENIITDAVFRCPSIGIALGSNPGQGFVYHMMDKPSFGKALPNKKGCYQNNLVCHGCLLPFVWNMNGFMGIQVDKNELELIKVVQQAIGHFAHYGKPPQRGKYAWPAVSNTNDNIAIFDKPFRVDRGQPDTAICNAWFDTHVKGFAMRPPSICRVGTASNLLGFGGQCSKICRKKGYAAPVVTGHSKGSEYWLCGAKGRAGVNINRDKKSKRPASAPKASSPRASAPQPRNGRNSNAGSTSRSNSGSNSRSGSGSGSRDSNEEMEERPDFFTKKSRRKIARGFKKAKKKVTKKVKKVVKKVKKGVKKVVKKVKKVAKKVVNKVKNFFGKHTCKVPGKGTKVRFGCFCETKKNQVTKHLSTGRNCGDVCRRAGKFAVLVSKGRSGWNYGCCANPGAGCQGGTNFAGTTRTICRTNKGSMRRFMCLCY